MLVHGKGRKRPMVYLRDLDTIMSAQTQYNLIREPVASLWIGKPLTAVERLCITSFLANGHPFHLYVYEEIGNIPAETTIRDAREILPENKVFSQSYDGGSNSITGFSDMFRYELLLKHGGWWVDMDVICLRPLDFPEEIVFGNHDEGGIMNTIIKFPSGHPLMRDMASRSHHPFSHFHGVHLLSDGVFFGVVLREETHPHQSSRDK